MLAKLVVSKSFIATGRLLLHDMCHLTLLSSRRVLPITLRLLNSMAETAMRGVSNPLMAIGMLTRL